MTRRATGPGRLFRGAWLVLRKDALIEVRTREVVVSTGLFAVLLVVLASLSLYVDPISAPKVAPGVLWIAITFTGVLGATRSWARERENDTLRALLASPIPRASIYLGKALSSLVFLVSVELALVPLVALFFQVDLAPILGRLVLLVVLGTIGFTAAATLFSAMTVRTSARDLSISIVLFPLVSPALLAAVVATRELFLGASYDEIHGHVQLLCAFDLAFVAGGLGLFEPMITE